MIRRLTCPICSQELPLEVTSDVSYFPFCCLRCKQVDLHRWLNADYAIAEPLTPDRMLGELPEEDLPPELRG